MLAIISSCIFCFIYPFLIILSLAFVVTSHACAVLTDSLQGSLCWSWCSRSVQLPQLWYFDSQVPATMAFLSLHFVSQLYKTTKLYLGLFSLHCPLETHSRQGAGAGLGITLFASLPPGIILLHCL